MGWVEMGFMGWVLKWSVFDDLKWVVLVNGVGRGGFYINAGWGGLKWILFTK